MSNSLSKKALYKSMFTDYPDVINIEQLCVMLGVGKKKAYELVRSGELRSLPCSKAIKIPKMLVIDYILRNI